MLMFTPSRVGASVEAALVKMSLDTYRPPRFCAHPHSLCLTVHAKLSTRAVAESPAQGLTAMPVDDRNEAGKAERSGNIGLALPQTRFCLTAARLCHVSFHAYL